MTVTFVSNYINHHQIPVSNRMYEKLGDGYSFVQTEPMEEERVKMGWDKAFGEIPYLKKYYENPNDCQKLIDESDVVIFGGTEKEELIADRLSNKKPVIRYSERLYKEGQWKCVSPRGLIKKYKDHTRHSDDPVFLLCAGGYVADDFNIIRAYSGKRFNWGYFPYFYEYSEEERKKRRDERRSHERLELIWAGRFIDWKHPEYCVEVAKHLKSQNRAFHFTLIGDGPLRNEVENRFKAGFESDEYTFFGNLLNTEVREAMNKADVFFLTSDYKEGWGAVLNEAMNAGCAIIASHAAGAVPTLIKHKQNGLVFQSGKVKSLLKRVDEVIADQKWRLFLGESAYETLQNEWNHVTAADRLLGVCEDIANDRIHFAASGPLSEAKVINQRKMYKHLIGGEQ